MELDHFAEHFVPGGIRSFFRFAHCRVARVVLGDRHEPKRQKFDFLFANDVVRFLFREKGSIGILLREINPLFRVCAISQGGHVVYDESRADVEQVQFFVCPIAGLFFDERAAGREERLFVICGVA